MRTIQHYNHFHPLSPKEFQKKLNDNRYKMVKVILDWEQSGSGCGMLNNLDDDNNEEHTIYASNAIVESCLTLESKSFSNLFALFLCHWEMKFQFFTGIGGMYKLPKQIYRHWFLPMPWDYCYVQVRTTSCRILRLTTLNSLL